MGFGLHSALRVKISALSSTARDWDSRELTQEWDQGSCICVDYINKAGIRGVEPDLFGSPFEICFYGIQS